MKLKNRKGFELAISTLVIIILAIVVVIALVIAFTGGWAKFWNNLKEIAPSDMQVVKNSCQTACDSNQQYDFCTRERNVKELGKINCTHEAINISCEIC